MQIKYKIIEIYPEEHQIVVRFYTDTCPESQLAIQTDYSGKIVRARTDVAITLFQIPILTGDALRDEIMRHAPVDWFELRDKIENVAIDTSMNSLMAMKGIEQVSASLMPVLPAAAIIATKPLPVTKV